MIQKYITIFSNKSIKTTIKNNSGIDETIKFIEQSDNCNSYDFIISEYVIPKNDITYVQITNSLETFYNINKADNGYDNLEKSDTHFLSPIINIKDKKTFTLFLIKDHFSNFSKYSKYVLFLKTKM